MQGALSLLHLDVCVVLCFKALSMCGACLCVWMRVCVHICVSVCVCVSVFVSMYAFVFGGRGSPFL